MISSLIEVRPGFFHPFPGGTVLQDMYMQKIRRGNRINTHLWPQKDGSRFKVLESSHMSPREMAASLEKYYPQVGKVYIEERTDAQQLIGFLNSNYDPKTIDYLIYHIHTFIGQFRILPIIRWHVRQVCFNASCLWPHLESEDDWGLLVDSAEDIALLRPHKIISAQLIDYQAARRLCRECGNVYHVRGKNVLIQNKRVGTF